MSNKYYSEQQALNRLTDDGEGAQLFDSRDDGDINDSEWTEIITVPSGQKFRIVTIWNRYGCEVDIALDDETDAYIPVLSGQTLSANNLDNFEFTQSVKAKLRTGESIGDGGFLIVRAW